MNEPMITLKWLREHGAWEERIWAWEDSPRAWQDRFGDRATVADTLKWLHETKEERWEAWLLAQTPEMTKAMLAAGADVHAADDEALVEAVERGRLRVVKLLRAAGADVNARNGGILRGAVFWGYLEIVKELRAAGADFGSLLRGCLLDATKAAGHTEVVDYVKSVMEGKDV